MKKWILSLFFLTCALFVACQKQESVADSLPDSMLEKIAQNARFRAYLKAERELEINLVRKAFDLDAVHKVLKSNLNLKACEIEDSNFEKLRGGVLYKKLHCEAEKAAESLKQEIPNYPSLSSAEWRKINTIHDRLYDIDWNAEIQQAALNRFKN